MGVPVFTLYLCLGGKGKSPIKGNSLQVTLRRRCAVLLA